MTAQASAEAHGSKSGSSNAAGECAFGYCTEVGGAAKGMVNMIQRAFLGIFGGGESSGGHHDAGH